jgi:hypothetical protein
MKTTLLRKFFKNNRVYALLIIAFISAVASELQAAPTPTPSPTPVKRKAKILPPDPTSGKPYSG